MKKLLKYFSKGEILLWALSSSSIILSFFLFAKNDYLTLFASIIGVTSLIFSAKGNPIGQVLMILFSVCYGVISYSQAYYGEMVTYLGMTLPATIVALFSWLKNPYKGNRSQVEVSTINRVEIIFAFALTVVVSFCFYFILKYFNTANLGVSTLSVATSFFAVYLTFRRSPYFALAYALNDIVLIVLWVFASFKSLSYISVVVCFMAFLVNDLYGFYSWKKMEKRQKVGL